MANPQPPLIPPQRSPMVDDRDVCTNEWYIPLRRVFEMVFAQDPAALEDILERLEELENATAAKVLGIDSVEVEGTLANGVVQIALLGDAKSPGNTRFYGTSTSGAKGWIELFTAFLEGTGIDLSTDSTGRITVALADLADSGNGALLAITRDAKGRVSGSRAAVAGDLPQHPHNDHSGIQGGAPGDYQHLTTAQVAKVDGLPDAGSGGPIILGGQMIQSGDAIAPASGGLDTSVAVVFPTPFGGVPRVVITPTSRSQSGPTVSEVTSRSASGFSAMFDVAEGSGGSSSMSNPVHFNWIAIGETAP
jgi:hypothetical protein